MFISLLRLLTDPRIYTEEEVRAYQAEYRRFIRGQKVLNQIYATPIYQSLEKHHPVEGNQIND